MTPRPRRIDQALGIRDAVTPLLRAKGIPERGNSRLTIKTDDSEISDIEFGLRTPFARLHITDNSDRIRNWATKGAPLFTSKNLPYGLDIWTGRKVFNLEWDEESGKVDLVTFKRGRWEEVVLRLAERA